MPILHFFAYPELKQYIGPGGSLDDASQCKNYERLIDRLYDSVRD